MLKKFLHLGQLISVQPLDGLIALLGDLGPVLLTDLVLHLLVLDGRLHVEAIGLEAVLCSNPILLLIVFSLRTLRTGLIVATTKKGTKLSERRHSREEKKARTSKNHGI
jgi:hypothetical protein